MENQTDLFADDHAFVGALFDHLDDIPEAEIANQWAGNLADMIEVMRTELCRQGEPEDQAKLRACKLAGVLAHYIGGQTIYMPTGERVKMAIRNAQIYHDFTGNNVRELIRKYKLSESKIYEIIREQRSLFRRRNQYDLFDKA
ncbi:Mor transcription activator family protein [Mannheimia massilioguelmaensis]|uniref:Mor transcription activator family protein n=1 Tax=Mannheimia massilioguelmaensis TaxID=1604354 RepID=UPI0005CA12BE|nr:Mor transcription activator family protein [Mannheimia massilioguelmaensis]